MAETEAAGTDVGKPVRHRVSARAWWAVTSHLRDTPRLTQKVRAEDVFALGIDGLLRVEGLEPSDAAAVFNWASAKVRAQRPGPTQDERFATLVAEARDAEDPAAEMERIAYRLWWSLPEYDREHALRSLSSASVGHRPS